MQAVLVIHGMGEQIPMDTLKGFVNAVWRRGDVITANGLPDPTEVWSKPDARTGSLELRRITTRESIASLPEFPKGVRTDFYELYWADLTAGATWDLLKAWVSGLLFRPLSRVPPNVRLAWAAVMAWLSARRVAGCSRCHALELLELRRRSGSRRLAMAPRRRGGGHHRCGASHGNLNVRAGGALHPRGAGQYRRPRRRARSGAQASPGAARRPSLQTHRHRGP